MRESPRFREEALFEFRVGSSVVLKGLVFEGRGRYVPWMDLDFFPPEGWTPSDSDRLFRAIAACLPPGGRLMVGYEELPRTLHALQRGVPPVLTPLGRLLYRAGFTWFRDWYIPEGGAEGGRKLQAHKPLNPEVCAHHLLRLKYEIRDFLLQTSGFWATTARAFLRALPLNIRLQGLYAVTDDAYFPSEEAWMEKTEAVMRGGVDLFQFRTKTMDRVRRIRLGERLRDLADRYAVEFVVNDDPGLARMLKADGVHVGKEDPDWVRVREILPGTAYFGVSSYDDLERARKAQEAGAAYVAFGAVFHSRTRPDHPVLEDWGSLLCRAKDLLDIPVGVIGGITKVRLSQLLQKVVPEMVAVVSALFNVADPQQAAKDMKTRLVRSQIREASPCSEA